MKRLYQTMLLGLGLWLASGAPASGQTSIRLSQQTQDADFSAAASTKPAKTGTSLPGSCEIGEQFFRSDAPAGQNLYGCTATDTWSLLGDGGGAGGAVDSVFGRTGVVNAQINDYTAGQVSNAPAGGISATSVQGALNELDSEKQPADADLTNIAGLVCTDGQIAKRVAGTWTCAADQTGGTGSLPATGGNAHRLLSNDGVVSDWRIVGPGLIIDSLQVGVDTAVVPTLVDNNTFHGPNTFAGEVAAAGVNSIVDFSAAAATKPVRTGTVLPATCLGSEEMFLNRNDASLWVCNASGDGWVPTGGGGGTVSLSVAIGDGVNPLPAGIAGYLEVPFECTVSRWTVLADQSGFVQVDVWKDTFANYPPTDADSITASAPIVMSSSQTARDTALTGWTTGIAQDDVLAFNVDSASTVTQVTVSLRCER